MKVSLIKTGLTAVLASAVLVACGGGGGGGDQFADNLVVNVNTTTAPILFDNGPMLFRNGIPGVSNTGPATLELTPGPTAGTTAFKIIESTGDQRTIEGSLIYGSCTFKVATPASLVGSIFIKTCSIRVTPSSSNLDRIDNAPAVLVLTNTNDPVVVITSLSDPFNERITRTTDNRVTFQLEPTGTVGPLQANPLTGAYN